MSPDQITAMGAVCVTLITAASTAIYRWTSKAGRTIRRLRRGIEAAEEYIYKMRRAALRAGVPARDLPRLPSVLLDLDVWSTPDLEDEEEDIP